MTRMTTYRDYHNFKASFKSCKIQVSENMVRIEALLKSQGAKFHGNKDYTLTSS